MPVLLAYIVGLLGAAANEPILGPKPSLHRPRGVSNRLGSGGRQLAGFAPYVANGNPVLKVPPTVYPIWYGKFNARCVMCHW